MQSGSLSVGGTAAIMRFNMLMQALADYRNSTVTLVDHSTKDKARYVLCVYKRDSAGQMSHIPIGEIFSSETEDTEPTKEQE